MVYITAFILTFSGQNITRELKIFLIHLSQIKYNGIKMNCILLDKNKPGFENVANLDKLPAKGIYVVALPMKIGKGSGAPLRIIAGVPSTK